ncbi:MAG TPA: thermonuclease family protein [Croceibacterium sp.]|nr:thermonuclease family protein [Croceibacterium sp.]
MVDGDTFWINGEKVRIETIDAPEINGQCPYERQLAAQARDRLAVLLGAGFQMQRNGADRYGRTLARITVQGRDAGAILISEGLARPWEGRRRPWCG